jgi:hypothetical protein
MIAKSSQIPERKLAAQAADDVGENLRREVTSFFKKLLTYHYQTESELDQSPLWQELPELLRRHCDMYADLAIANRSLRRAGRVEWVKKEIEADQNAIMIQHFRCDAKGYLVKAPETTIPEQASWRAMAHYGFLNFNAVCGVFQQKLRNVVSEAVKAANIKIFSHTEGSSAAGRSRGKTPDLDRSKPLNKRQAFVLPILKRRGWSTPDWAKNSDVDFHTADSYLKNESRPYRSTRAKFAKSLGVEFDDLPE